MSFNDFAKEVEDKNYTIVENKTDGVLISYDVTYKYAGKELSENVNVAGLSKKTTNKKLDDVKKKLKSKVRFVNESTAQYGNPGTDIIQNDYAKRLFPHSFTTDTTTLSPKEVLDVVQIVALADPLYIKTYINQAEDALATFEKLGQTNRVNDLRIRIGICKNALLIADKRGDSGQLN